jgi:hypothetical protein
MKLPPKPIRPQFFEITTHCVHCAKLVPPERLKFKAITCSEECARLRKLSMRARQDSRECRFCRKPTTPAEKASYQRFRKWEAAHPELAYPAQFKRFDAYREEKDAGYLVFTLAVAQRMAEEDEDAAERARAERADAARGTVAPPPEMEPVRSPGP